MDTYTNVWPITFQQVLEAEKRIRPYIPPSPLRNYPALDEAIGFGTKIFVKHENHNPTNSFKARNALSVITSLSKEEKRRGVVAATRGNHGQGLAWAGQMLGVPVTVCVPLGNNPDKNDAMRGFGAEIIEEGRDYDEAVAIADRLVRERGLRLVHSTNEPLVVAGAATLTLESLREQPDLDALIVSVGGGSQAVGAMTVARELNSKLKIYGVQAERASAAHDSWHSGQALARSSADTFADGLATRRPYELTFRALCEGLDDFVLATESEIAESIRLYIRATHNLAEGAGAAALAGLFKLRETLKGKRVGVVLSGGNIDEATLRRVLNHEV